MFGLPAYRIQTYEATGLGSSIVAFAAMGIYADPYAAAAKMVRVKDQFLPDPKEHETYKFLFEEVFSKIFGKLLPLYKTVSKLEGA
jgi:sugar (pentulose or hexulose) kinase